MEFSETARLNMVRSQILPNKVFGTALIDALSATPRHLFVDTKFQGVAYSDSRIPLNDNRFLLTPEIFARLVEALNIQKSDRVLDVACGTGYSSAILSQLCSQVVAKDGDSDLLTKALTNIKALEIGNVRCKLADVFEGDPSGAPYDAILINGAIEIDPRNLLNQLTLNGRLVCVMPANKKIKKAFLFQNFASGISKQEIFDAETPIIV